MIIKPASPEAYRLMHDGILALSRVEEVGIKVDVPYVRKTMRDMKRQIAADESTLRDSEEYSRLRKRFGTRTNIKSRRQLATLFFDVLGYKATTLTAKGNPKLDERALTEIGTPFAKAFLSLEKLNKLYGTFLSGIMRETEGDRLHPCFNLHVPRTFRSSSDSPNFQNYPVRDPFMAEIIRNCFIAEEGYHIIETDYVGAEIRGAACYHKDPRMLRYIKDPSKDMHRDMARQCFLISTPEEIEAFQANEDAAKNARYCAKNMFVFPQFYGDFYKNNAVQLWEATLKMKLMVGDAPMIKHLKSKGINGRGECVLGRAGASGEGYHEPAEGTFEAHLKMVENDFWNNRFKVYGKWKKTWLESFERTGGFQMLTGFRIEGNLAKNDIINYPVQGASFHWLLWSLIQTQRELRRRKMKSRIIGQIHDSLIGEVHHTEVGAYSEIVHRVMTQDVREHWDWIIVPLDIEMEAAPRGGSWYKKKKVSLKDMFAGKL
jgi:DNA polymerase-1